MLIGELYAQLARSSALPSTPYHALLDSHTSEILTEYSWNIVDDNVDLDHYRRLFTAILRLRDAPDIDNMHRLPGFAKKYYRLVAVQIGRACCGLSCLLPKHVGLDEQVATIQKYRNILAAFHITYPDWHSQCLQLVDGADCRWNALGARCLLDSVTKELSRHIHSLVIIGQEVPILLQGLASVFLLTNPDLYELLRDRFKNYSCSQADTLQAKKLFKYYDCGLLALSCQLNVNEHVRAWCGAPVYIDVTITSQLSLFATAENITSYNSIFAFLASLLQTQQQLSALLVTGSRRQLKAVPHNVLLLRARMLFFFNAVYTHMQTSVVQPELNKLLNIVNTETTTLTFLAESHQVFLHTLLACCFLDGKAPAVSNMLEALDACATKFLRMFVQNIDAEQILELAQVNLANTGV